MCVTWPEMSDDPLDFFSAPAMMKQQEQPKAADKKQAPAPDTDSDEEYPVKAARGKRGQNGKQELTKVPYTRAYETFARKREP